MANEHSQIVPSMQPTAKVADFKFWCQKVLPLVYDDSLSYYEVLNKMAVYLNQVIDNINADIDNVAELEDDFLLLQEYVNNFFDDIDQLVTYAERAEAAQTAAAGSALNAATSATNAATSASNAATSATNAASSSLNAMNARDAAIAAKTAAESALANAQTAATNAANSATAASNSATAASGSATNAAASAASALQNFQLSDAARVAAQEAAEDAEEAAETIVPIDISDTITLRTDNFTILDKSIIRWGPFIFYSIRCIALNTTASEQLWANMPISGNQGISGSAWQRCPQLCVGYSSNIADPYVIPCAIGDKVLRLKGVTEGWYYEVSGFFKHNL